MAKATTQTDLNKVTLKEEVEGVRGDMEDTTDVGEADQVAVVEDQVGMVVDQVAMAVVEGGEDMAMVQGKGCGMGGGPRGLGSGGGATGCGGGRRATGC